VTNRADLAGNGEKATELASKLVLRQRMDAVREKQQGGEGGGATAATCPAAANATAIPPAATAENDGQT
jgi:hypothetical protein